MKVIIGSESFAPNISGVATAAELLARKLAENGHEVFIFAPSRSFRSHWDPEYKDFKVLRIKSIANPFRKGFRVAFLPKSVVFKQVAAISPDIIHLQDPTSICSQLLRSAEKNKIPLVVTNHFSLDYVLSYLKWLKPVHRIVREILRRYLANFYNRADAVICPTETVKKDLLGWGVSKEVTPISNGVDLDRFFSYSDLSEIRNKYHLPLNPIVLYMGRVDKDKSIDVLVNAMPKVVKETNAHFVIAGMGDEITKMKKLIEKLGISEAVSWIGWLDKNSDEFPMVYQAATLFAIPSTIETQSIVTMEAMAAGLPIVGPDSGALPELIKDGKNGFLARPKDFDDMAEKIIEILKNDNLKQKMGASSLKIVSEHQIEKSYAKTMKIYTEISGEK